MHRSWTWPIGIVWLLAVSQVTLSAAGEATAEGVGAELAADLRDRRPPQPVVYTGSIETRAPSGERRSIAVRYETRLGSGVWEAVYRTFPDPASSQPAEQLRVIHRSGLGLEYRWTHFENGQPGAEKVMPGGDGQASQAFAGSDFVACDLGLDFLHWPTQRVVKVKHSMRKGRACKVLESSGPDPKASYQRVLSWIDVESGGPIYAEAYNAAGKLLKVFEVDRVTKVEGEWQLTEMKMRNEIADTRTAIRFDPARP